MSKAPVVNPAFPPALSSDRIKGRRLRNLGFRILLAAAVLALLTPAMGTARLGFGIWYQTEGVIAALLAVAALAAAGLAVLYASGARLAQAVNWLAAAPAAAIAAWAFIALPAQDFPGRALYGSPELGEGALWYVCLAVLIPAFSVLWRHARSAAGLLLLAAAGWVFVAAVMYWGDKLFALWPVNWNWFLPLLFPDYLAFTGFFIIAAAASLWRRAQLWLIVFCICAGVFAVIASKNNSAIGLLILAPFMGGLYALLRRRMGGLKTRRLAAAGGLAAAAAATVIIWLVDFQPIVNSDAPRTVKALANSVVSRHHLMEIVAKDIAAQPDVLAFGKGFGAYTDIFAAHLPVEWVNLRSDDRFLSGARAANLRAEHWDAVMRVDFHSHNFFADHLIYGGALGLILICWLFLAPVLRPPQPGAAAAVSAALCVMLLATVWFMPAAVAGVMALWLGAAAPRPKNRRAPVIFITRPRALEAFARPHALGAFARPRALAAASAGLALILAVTAADSVRFSFTARNFHPHMDEPLKTAAEAPANCPQAYHDRGRGGARLGNRLGSTSYTLLTTALADGAPNPDILRIMRAVSCAALLYTAENPASLQLRIAFVRAMGEMAFMTRLGELQTLFAALAPQWPEMLDAILAQAPKRADLASTYLLYLLAEHDKAAFGRAAEKLHGAAPETPVAQWFYGIHLLNGAAPGAGLAVMKTALEGGVERFIPVDPKTKAGVLGTETAADAAGRLPMRRLSIQTKTGVHDIDAEIAATKETREAGLQGRLSLPAGSGMLLVFDEPQDVSMWMKDTYIPLDMIFITENGTVAHIEERTEPQSMVVIGPVENVSYVLEVNAGFVERTGAAPGDLVRY